VIAAEMHAGFQPLRRELPMNVWRPVKRRDFTADAAANVSRIDAMWSECRARFGEGGPFLFGRFSGADAMYAPVVSRFVTYDVPVSPVAKSYMDAVQALPAWLEWRSAALREQWVLEHDEVDWPEVPRMPAADDESPAQGRAF
jgi:glutathione S-transferase